MKKIIKSSFWLIFLLFFSGIIFHFGDQKITDETDNIEESDSLLVQIDSTEIEIPEDIDTTTYKRYKKFFRWKNLSGKSYQIKFYYSEKDLIRSREYRNTLNSYSTTLYRQLHVHDSSSLAPVVEAFRALKIWHQLNRYQLMEAVITFIQSIPYTYILDPNRQCGSTIQTSKGSYFTYPDYNCKPSVPAGCCDNVTPWGLYSPIEFLIQETGDCDTRTLLALSILEKFDYDIAIVNSNKMGHSMLGVYVPFVPGNGNYGLTAVSRKKYYLWELTAKGLRLGDNYDFYSNDWLVTYQ